MLGWLSEASTLASRSNRASRSGSVAKASGKIFSATCRFSFRVSGSIDLSHAALPDEGGHVVVAESRTDA